MLQHPLRVAAAVFVVALTACTPAAVVTSVTDAPATTTTAPASTTTVPPAASPRVPVPPLPPEDYGAMAFGAWISGDSELLARLTTDLAFEVLADRSTTQSDRWTFTSCQEVLGHTYCTWTGTSEILALRIDNESIYEGRSAVIDVRFAPAG